MCGLAWVLGRVCVHLVHVYGSYHTTALRGARPAVVPVPTAGACVCASPCCTCSRASVCVNLFACWCVCVCAELATAGLCRRGAQRRHCAGGRRGAHSAALVVCLLPHLTAAGSWSPATWSLRSGACVCPTSSHNSSAARRSLGAVGVVPSCAPASVRAADGH